MFWINVIYLSSVEGCSILLPSSDFFPISYKSISLTLLLELRILCSRYKDQHIETSRLLGRLSAGSKFLYWWYIDDDIVIWVSQSKHGSLPNEKGRHIETFRLPGRLSAGSGFITHWWSTSFVNTWMSQSNHGSLPNENESVWLYCRNHENNWKGIKLISVA